jgi:hypothetical protein
MAMSAAMTAGAPAGTRLNSYGRILAVAVATATIPLLASHINHSPDYKNYSAWTRCRRIVRRELPLEEDNQLASSRFAPSVFIWASIKRPHASY